MLLVFNMQLYLKMYTVRYFLRILTPQVESSFFVQHAQHQWLPLERYTHCCQCEQVLYWPSHENIIPSIFTL